MKLRIIIVVVLFLGLIPSYQTLAVVSSENQPRKQSSNRPTISSQQAASIVQSRYGGKVLKVQKNQSSYRVKLIRQDGRIISVSVDAVTGKIRG